MNGAFLLARIRELRKASIVSALHQNHVIQARMDHRYDEEGEVKARDKALLEETTLLLTVVDMLYNLPADQKNDLIRTLNEEIILWTDRVSGFVPETPGGPRSSKLYSL